MIERNLKYGLCYHAIANCKRKNDDVVNVAKRGILNPEGYVTKQSNGTSNYYYYAKDHLGNNRAVFGTATPTTFGGPQQEINYYPFGMPFYAMGILGGYSTGTQPYKFGDKEYDEMHGLNWYDFGARYYSGIIPVFMSMDPLCEKYYSVSPYAYCMNNPINAIDPDGRSTYVLTNDDGTYRVVGGNLDDDDLNIYALSAGNGGLVYTSIGRSSSITSFYNSDDGAWMTGSIINPNDNSGTNFLNDIVQNNPEMGDYTSNATGGKRYDFKVTNGTGENYSNTTDYYRGMPIGKDKDGTVIYSSARDVGNIAAGYVAGSHRVNWDLARQAFDALESQQKGYNTVEGISTQNAQRVGWESGWNAMQKSPIWSTYYMLRDIPFDIRYLYKKFKGK